MDPGRTKEILQSALRAAGKELIKHYRNKNIIRKKESISSVVTDADFASEKVIFEILESAPSPCNIISEESGFINKGSRYTWVVDPLEDQLFFAEHGAGAFKNDIPISGTNNKILEEQLIAYSFDYQDDPGKALHRNHTIVASSSGLHRELIQIIHQKPVL